MECFVDTNALDPSVMLEVKICGGFDGAGSFSIWRNSSHESPNHVLVGMKLMSISEKVSGLPVYVEKSMGPETEIPIALFARQRRKGSVS